MNPYSQQNDPLKKLFEQLPQEQLPASFRSAMMQQIMAESMRMKKRSERLLLMAVVLASLVMLVFGVLAVVYLEIPQFTLSFPKFPSFSSSSFCLYIGGLFLLLLFGDYKMRKYYNRKHKNHAD